MSATKKQQGYSSQVPAWVWLFTGSVLGAFVMFLVYLRGVPPQPGSGLTDKLPELTTRNPGTATDAEDKTKPRFVFYELLKETEVKVNPPPLQPKAGTPENPLDVHYTLQAGSFRTQADADRMRAQLILLNLDAKVLPAQVGDVTWHRVMVGPFTTRAQAATARGKLASINVDSILREIPNDG